MTTSIADRVDRPISFDRALEMFARECDQSFAQHDWARHVMHLANEQLGAWELRFMPVRSVFNILLPHHQHGEIELIPPHGLTVFEAAHRRSHLKAEYERACPRCHETIEYFIRKPVGTLILSSAPITAMFEYAQMDWDGQLVHIDGLHRLLALALSGSQEQAIRCIVAVSETAD